jgi:hypothetical protein
MCDITIPIDSLDNLADLINKKAPPKMKGLLLDQL